LIDEKQEKYLKDEEYIYEYTFEPSPKEVLDEMIPRLIEVQLFQALLESNASEHSARMSAMHQATDAAKDMVNELTLFYNKARQASITAEIAEISAGANALAN
jgi:F-type H+-transporting ATPase subunit gamma